MVGDFARRGQLSPATIRRFAQLSSDPRRHRLGRHRRATQHRRFQTVASTRRGMAPLDSPRHGLLTVMDGPAPRHWPSSEVARGGQPGDGHASHRSATVDRCIRTLWPVHVPTPMTPPRGPALQPHDEHFPSGAPSLTGGHRGGSSVAQSGYRGCVSARPARGTSHGLSPRRGTDARVPLQDRPWHVKRLAVGPLHSRTRCRNRRRLPPRSWAGRCSG